MIISTSYITPLQISCNSHFPPILGTDLKRTWNGLITDLLLWQKQSRCDFFKELNAKHVHGGEFCMITHCVSKRL